MAPTRTTSAADDTSKVNHASKTADKMESDQMVPALKYLDRKRNEKSQWYYAETVHDEAIPEQVDW